MANTIVSHDKFDKRNREQFFNGMEELVAFDSVPKITKALLNKNHPLFKKVMNDIQQAAANKANAIEFSILIQDAILCLNHLREEAAKTKQTIADSIAAEEVSLARIKEARQAKRDAITLDPSLSLQKIIQGLEDTHAWIKSIRQNVRQVTAEIPVLNDEIEMANKDWIDLQPTFKVQGVNELIASYGKTVEVKVIATNQEGQEVEQPMTVDLVAKREELEKAYELPAPGKMLALNPALQTNILPFFNVLRAVRVLGAMSSNKQEECHPRAMLALIKQHKMGNLELSKEEQEKVVAANDLIKERRSKEAVLARLNEDLATATKRFGEYEQKMLAYKEHHAQDTPDLDSPEGSGSKFPRMGGG